MTPPDQSNVPAADAALTSEHRVCVLWHPRGQKPTVALLKALANKGMRVTLADEVHAAFAACSVCKDVAARTVLVLDGRPNLRGVDRVLGALERFGPGVICWEHRDGANPPMVPVVQVARPAAPVDTCSDDDGGVRDVVPLRLVGDEALERDGAGTRADLRDAVRAAKRGPVSARDVLDADELDALLAGELGEMGERPGRR